MVMGRGEEVANVGRAADHQGATGRARIEEIMTSAISGTSSTTVTESLTELLKTQATSGDTKTSGTTGSMPPPPPECDLSKGGELLSKLEALKTEDPEAFAETLTEISESLAEEAASAEGKDKEMLEDLAAKFATAAETGDLTGLEPQPPPQQYENSTEEGLRTLMENSTQSASGADPGASMRNIMDGIMSKIDDALAS
jgi:hypothetical protein